MVPDTPPVLSTPMVTSVPIISSVTPIIPIEPSTTIPLEIVVTKSTYEEVPISNIPANVSDMGANN